jgi:hypothetical protein
MLKLIIQDVNVNVYLAYHCWVFENQTIYMSHICYNKCYISISGVGYDMKIS